MEQNFNVQLVPYDWRTCLTFRGAKDLGFLKSILDEYALDGLNPLNSNEDNAIRAAESENYVLIYLPTAGTLDFGNFGFSVNKCRVIDLQKRTILEGKVENNTLQMLPILEDELVIISKIH